MVNFRHQLAGQNSLVFLSQAGLQAEVQFAASDGLSKEIGHTAFVDGPFVRSERQKTRRESIGEVNPATERRQLAPADFDRDLNSSPPASFLHVEDAGLDVRVPIHRIRPEEQCHTIG